PRAAAAEHGRGEADESLADAVAGDSRDTDGGDDRVNVLITILFLAATTTPKQTIDDVLRDYVAGFLQRNPTVNTYLGAQGDADGRLRDHSAAALTKEDAWLRGVERKLAAFDASKLTPQQRIDRDVAVAQIRFQLHLHGIRKYQQRSVDTYTDEPFRAI